MKIAFFSTKPYDRIWFEPLSVEYETDIHFLEAKLDYSTASLAFGYEAVCAFVNDDLSEEVINILAKNGVKLLLMRCAGYNNVNLPAAVANSMVVLRVPSYSPESVAEFSMALALCVNRKVHRAYIRTRDFNMNINGLMGRDFCNKTAGIVGTGKIGRAMIRICKGFGMRVIAYDPFPDESSGIEYVPLEKLFSSSDLISLHCPLTAETHYIIDEKSLNSMQDNVIIINTSRGALIKTTALLDALLIPGKIGGIGLDVYEEEGDLFYEDNSNKIMEDDKLARLTTFQNVIITSHQGYFTREAMQAIAIETMENVYAYKNKLSLKNRVT